MFGTLWQKKIAALFITNTVITSLTPPRLWKSFSVSRSVIFRRKRAESDNSLVSEGLREAITSYLQMTEGTNHSWDTWTKTVDQSEIMMSDRQIDCCQILSCLICSFGHWKRLSARPKCSLRWTLWRAETLRCLEMWHTVCQPEECI